MKIVVDESITGCPALAGIGPHQIDAYAPKHRLPRARGDRPAQTDASKHL